MIDALAYSSDSEFEESIYKVSEREYDCDGYQESIQEINLDSRLLGGPSENDGTSSEYCENSYAGKN